METDLIITRREPEQTGHTYTWDWLGDSGCTIRCDDQIIAEFATRFSSRDGSWLVGLLHETQADRLQFSDHTAQMAGEHRRSVQLFRGDDLVGDYNLPS